MRVAAAGLAGSGVGEGVARGLVDVAGGFEVSPWVGNVGDDLEVLGMSRLARPRQHPLRPRRPGTTRSEAGVGQARPGRRSATISTLGGEDWFRLGDRDLGLHLVLDPGASRGRAALRRHRPARLARSGSSRRWRRATDDRLRTWIDTPAGSFAFQEWFVASRPPRRGRRRPLRGRCAHACAWRGRGDRAGRRRS